MNYKSPDNQLHFIDPAFEHLLPAGCVQITQEEADAIHLANQPVVDKKEVALAQIKSMEQEQMMPRATREFMLLFLESQFTPTQLSQSLGYRNVKAFDNKIKELRDTL